MTYLLTYVFFLTSFQNYNQGYKSPSYQTPRPNYQEPNYSPSPNYHNPAPAPQYHNPAPQYPSHNGHQSGYNPVFHGRSAAPEKPDEADKTSTESRLNGGAIRFADK